jgi:predicted Zn-dependent protease
VNRPQEAAALLRRVEKDFAADPTFWFEVAGIAAETQDMDTLAEAVARSYRLQPDNPVFRHNQAAVLIATGRQPEEAVRLTLELLNRSPESVSCQVNHALALILQRRLSDAEELLARIPWAGRSPTEETQMHYGWMLIEQSRGRLEAAKTHARALRESELLPPQRARREAVLATGGSPGKPG